VKLQRLNPATDVDLYDQMRSWDETAPRWLRDMDAAFICRGEDEIHIGVYEESLIAVITLTRHAAGIYEAHLRAARGTSLTTLAIAALSVQRQLWTIGAKLIFVYVGERNKPVRQLCDNIGFQPDGIVVYKGSSHGRIVKWVRYSSIRPSMAAERAA
jgi:hypothetical protein